MPSVIAEAMLAPCGINCAVCYRHVNVRKSVRPCAGCLKGDTGKTGRCLACKIKACAAAAGHTHCFACVAFPCRALRRLEKSYAVRYAVSVVQNGITAREKGVAALLAADRARFTCACGGAISLQDGRCSDCAAPRA